MASERSLPVEILWVVAEQSDWSDETERRSMFHRLVLVNKDFNAVFTQYLYKEYMHSEGNQWHAQNLESFLSTIQKNSSLAKLIQKLTIKNWHPESFHVARGELERPIVEPVSQLLSRACNVREVCIELPLVPHLLDNPFHELEILTLQGWNPFIRTSSESRILTLELLNNEGQLNLSCLTYVFPLPKLTNLRIEAFECLGGTLLSRRKPFGSKLSSLQIHSGCIDTSVVSKLMQSIESLKVYRYSVMEFDAFSMVRTAHPGTTPSTRIVVEDLRRHSETLETLEITKRIGLSTREDEVINSLHDFEQLRSLCVDASILIGRWHCQHTPEPFLDGGNTTVVDLDKPEWRPARELAQTLPSGLEELVLGVDDDKSHDYILDILKSIIEQRKRLSKLRRVAFFHNRVFYCKQCMIEHGDGPIDARYIPERRKRGPHQPRYRKLRDNVKQMVGDTGLEVHTIFEYKPWPNRKNLWDEVRPFPQLERGMPAASSIQRISELQIR